MALPHNRRYTPDEYLAQDRASEFKHEYLDGEITMMAGAKPAHSLIAMNAGTSLNNRIGDRDCIVYGSDLRVSVRHAGLYAYPDLTVVCGPPLYDECGETLLNPTLIVEVLSPTTETYDRGEKFRRYQQLESLQEYVLIDQGRPVIEVFTRQPGGKWLYVAAIGLETLVTLESVGCTLALADVYRRVTFAEDAAQSDAAQDQH
ncbi:MAG: Uma2 family endonuclease [Anaerolineae bacterium]|nr:Uma2 family endonuclease [Anaerolineae bacterium]NUQ05549.1 Uma2 family endonuclease [Anaerolineae bacterium]